jgi:Na+/melibiose symporter-like transporter
MLALFAIAYGSLAAAAASIWALPADVAPTPQHVASLAGIQNFASNLAGIALTTFTGVMLQMTQGSFTIPLVVAGGFCVLGALSYLLVVGRVEPLRAQRNDALDEQAYARQT